MDWITAGRIASKPNGDWNELTYYHKLDVVTYAEKTYMAKKDSIGQEPVDGENNEYWMLLIEPDLIDVAGATDEEDGFHGLVSQPLAGDQDKSYMGDGTWGKKLQTSVVDRNGVYAYMDSSNNVRPFITYESAIRDAMIGTAGTADVLSGRTFTNSTSRGLSGTMRDYSRSQIIVTNGAADAYKPAMRKTTISGTQFYEISMPTGYWAWSPGYSGALVPAEEKTVTPGTSKITVEPTAGKVLTKVTINAAPAAATQTKTVAAGTSNVTVKPDSGKLLSQVTVTPTPSQSKTVTASRSNQTVKPDSGKLLSQVVVNKFPDASGTYNCGSNNGGYTSNDMGTGNNYRYVNATAVYNKGKADGAYAGEWTEITLSYGDIHTDDSYRSIYLSLPVNVYYAMAFKTDRTSSVMDEITEIFTSGIEFKTYMFDDYWIAKTTDSKQYIRPEAYYTNPTLHNKIHLYKLSK